MNYEKSMPLRARKGDLYIQDKTYIVYKDKDKKDEHSKDYRKRN